MKYVMLVLLLTGCGHFTALPYEKRYAIAPRVYWIVVDNAEAECISRGLKPPGYFKFVDACAVFNRQQCEIITNKNTTMEILGHELRHCFEGRFHD